MSPYVQTDIPEGQSATEFRFRNGGANAHRVRTFARRASPTLAIVALIGGASVVAGCGTASVRANDTDGQPTRMVRVPPMGMVHVGPVRELSGRIGSHVLITRRCTEDSAIGQTWCLG